MGKERKGNKGEREKKKKKTRIWIPTELDLLHSASAADR